MELKKMEKGIENKWVVSFLDHLRAVLEKAVEMQKNNSKDCLMIVFDEEELVDDETLLSIVQSITNCCFTPNTGEEVFSNTINDGKPHLMFHSDCLAVFGGVGAVERFSSSSIYNQCVHIQTQDKSGISNDCFYIDCGEDVEMMMDVMTTVLCEIYEWKPTCDWAFDAVFIESKKTAQKNAVKTAQYNVKKMGLNAIRIQ